MKYLIAVLLSALFCALAALNAPALTKTAVHKAAVVNTTEAAQPKPENKGVATQKAQAVTPAPQEPKVETVVYASGCETYRSTFALYWSGSNLDTALAICQAESGGNPYAVSPPNYDGLRDYGLMQIHGEDILNPSANIARAHQKYETQGWHAWTTYTSGRYLAFLNE